MSRIAATVRAPLAAACLLAAGLTAACSDAPTGVSPASSAAPDFGKGASAPPALTGRIAFASLDPDNYANKIWVINPDGTGLQQITSDAGLPAGHRRNDRAPAWSPDAQLLAIARSTKDMSNLDAPEFKSIKVIHLDGTVERTFLAEEQIVEVYKLAWAPDGQSIAACVFKTGDTKSRLVLLRPGANSAQYLSDGVSSQDCEPEFSPDGTKLAFTRTTQSGFFIMTMNVDGTGAAPVLTSAGNGFGTIGQIDWSPDGRRLFFHAYGANGADVYSVLTNGSKLTRVTNLTGDDYGPSLSPDGKTMVINRSGGLPSSGFYLLNADGTNMRLLLGRTKADFDPAWSPR
jgi:Tol biopolymer transport system component